MRNEAAATTNGVANFIEKPMNLMEHIDCFGPGLFDAAAAPGSVASATRLSPGDGNVQSGQVLGVLLRETDTNHVVLFGAGPESQPVSGTISYVVPAVPTAHLLANLIPRTAYSVVTVVNGGNVTITVAPGGRRTETGFTSDDAGLLYLTTNERGQVAPVVASTATVKTTSPDATAKEAAPELPEGSGQ